MKSKFKVHPSGWALFFVILLTAACAPSSQERNEMAHRIALDDGFVRQSWAHPTLPIVTYHRFRSQTATLNIYIEGDGYAFASRRRPSDDPTPVNPVSLKLALSSTEAAVAYIGRPCQYVTGSLAPGCDPIYWTSHRYAPEVVDAIQLVINQLKIQAGAARITLTGFSGGGVVAALIAARRNDVAHLTTVAAPLSVEAWLAYHGLSPLAGEDPLDQIDRLCEISQAHYWGEADEVVPVGSIISFVRGIEQCRNVQVNIISGAEHQWNWAAELARASDGASFRGAQH